MYGRTPTWGLTQKVKNIFERLNRGRRRLWSSIVYSGDAGLDLISMTVVVISVGGIHLTLFDDVHRQERQNGSDGEYQ